MAIAPKASILFSASSSTTLLYFFVKMPKTKCILVGWIFKSGGNKTETQNHKHEYSANAYTQPTHFIQPFQTNYSIAKIEINNSLSYITSEETSGN